MGNTNTKETVFKSGCFGKPTYRIPALVFQDNNFLAFSEKRLNGSKDVGAMEMVLRRGYLGDDGVKWEHEITLYPEDPAVKMRPMNPVPIVVGEHHIILMFNAYPEEEPVKCMKKEKTPVWQLLKKHSYDGGKTWSTSEPLPANIFSDSKGSVPTFCSIGPGHGIKLNSGRLVVCGVTWLKGRGTKTVALLSDDDGVTWKMGGDIPFAKDESGTDVRGNECQAVEVAPDQVVINCRTSGTYPRLQCRSFDRCDSFAVSKLIDTLNEPKNGCEGSVLGFRAPSDDETWVLFSNPNCCLKMKLSVRLSKDGCNTWSCGPIKVLERLGSAYSDLTGYIEDSQQKFACLFERNKITTRNINFIRFTIDN